ncbi:hypothetical protein GCM10027346_37870 [Hymenobacter seoulensis]
MRFLLLIVCLFWSCPTVSQPINAPAPAPELLTAQQLRHLMLFTRLAGSVRYFYPNQATGRADWTAFYVATLPGVLHAPSTRAFRDTLRRAFSTIAPAVVVQGPEKPSLPPAITGGPAYRWEHHSLNLDKQGLGLVSLMMRLAHLPFTSRLVAAPPTAQLPAAYTLPLGDSVAAILPLVLPTAQAYAPIAFKARTRRFLVRQRAHRLALIMQTWNVLQQFYPYREQLRQADWPGALHEGLLAANAAQTDASLLVACQQMVARLGDRHVQVAPQTRTGLYITPPDFALGFALLPDGRTVVARSRGKWAALCPMGSILEQVNGRPTEQVLDSLQRQTSARRGLGGRQVVVHQLLRYFWRQGAAVDFTIRTSSDTVHRFPVSFRQLRLPASRAGAFRNLRDSLVYLDASRLRYADFLRQLPALQHARGLIVDLRQRPAYGMQEALAHWTPTALYSDWLATPVLRAPDFTAARFDSVRSIIAARSPQVTTPTVFLVGPDTYSYGETLVELIRHYHLGLLLGQPTGGTNGEMNFVSISHHFRLSWTGRRVCNRDQEPYQGKGIFPAVAVDPTLRSIQQHQDAALEQAVHWLTSPPPGPGR